MKIQFKDLVWVIATLWVISSCDIADNKDVDPADSFLRIYDSHQFDHEIRPVDIVQTAEGGYLFLGNYRREDVDFLGTYVSSADEEGQFVRNTYLTDDNVHPVGKFLELGGEHYFISMDAVSLQAYLNQVNDSARIVSTTGLGVTYPMYAENDGEDQFVLLSYNSLDRTTMLSLVNADGSIAAQSAFGIGAGQEVEEPIIDHFTRTGRELPFFAGRSVNGTYYANGFYNYTLSLLFTDLSDDTPSGVIQGQQDQGGISSLISLSGDNYGLARFNYGDQYANAIATLNTLGTTSSSDLAGSPMLEWAYGEKVKMTTMTLGSSDYIIMATTTKNQQIVLHFYDNAGAYVAVDYLGFSSPYQLGAIHVTSDNGLAILGSTQVAGKFQRLCLFKKSENELKDLVQ
ncbi:hypothetical protein SAMN04488029_3906 [Reichenbachiella faecimaris]|uniref:DUF4374 domain-containing protein n=1 Tax=Reichenbachiella faecimaris TaxID=692418 RepID=A0A1W2GQC4_REIFA|nr:hypothetical protein [Reichenbachiella faecimaris]SMD38847.1 hypothetical protein SAMN04488029_3906 [Reichenbachiella faecimaris]